MDAKGITTSIAKGHCTHYNRDNNNEMLARLEKTKTDGLHVAQIMVPKISVAVAFGATKQVPKSHFNVTCMKTWHIRMRHTLFEVIKEMIGNRNCCMNSKDLSDNV